MSNNKSTTAAVVAAATFAGLTAYYWDKPIFAKSVISQKISRNGLALPFLGDALTVMANLHRFHDWILETIEKAQGGPALVTLPFEPAILIFNDPKIVEHFLKTKFPIYDKGPYFKERCQDVLGHGIFNSDGELWRSQRKTAANIFNVKNFKDFVGVVFTDEMESLNNRLSQFAESNAVFDLQDIFFRFTLDGFCKIGFGIDLHSMTEEKPVPFAAAFDQAQLRMMHRFVLPLWRLEELLLPIGKSHAEHVKTIRTFGLNMIRQRHVDIENGTFIESENNDLLTLLKSVKDEDGNSPSDELLCDYVLNFIIAGRDTTAQALSWTFLMLHQNPAALDSLLKEINETLGDAETPTYEQIKNMEYANAVFHETLRLYPSVPQEVKQANKDDILPDGTIIPKNTLVMWSPYCMGRTEAIWGPDAKKFRPERWLEMQKQPSPFDYPVFNAGPRVCLGKNMAELEGVFVMVSLLRRWKVTVLEAEKVTYANSLTLPMATGLKVKVERRV
ncbi:hypothetical protein HDU76_010321 [Blyttiomyces sp. JEL0837]|nr:hypothetical protein HDU76_010321 [Blyttiomyces sp. JEL0837]